MRRALTLAGLGLALAGTAPARAQQAAIPQVATPEAAPAPLAGPRPIREGVAAVVNDEIISSYDLRQRLLLLILTSGVQPTQESLPQIEREALRQLVDERLELQDIRAIEARQKLKLQPTDKEIDDEVNDLAKQNNMTGQQLQQNFRAAGVDPQTLRDQLKVQIAWRRFIGGRFGSSIRISERQIDEAIKRNDAQAQKQQYLMSQVFLDAARSGGQAAAEDGAKQLVAQIKAGAPFAAVARQFSALPTAANGGDAGWLTTAEIPPPVLAAVEQMKPGQVSDPIPTTDGVYIVLLREKRAGAGATLVKLKQAALRLTPDAKPEDVAAAQATLTALRSRLKGCSGLEAEAGKVSGVVAGDFGDVEVSDLRPEFQQAVTGLKPGEVSQPLRTNAGLHLLALCERRVGGAKAPTRDDIENRIFGEQLSMVAKRYLRDLRNSATIEAR